MYRTLWILPAICAFSCVDKTPPEPAAEALISEETAAVVEDTDEGEAPDESEAPDAGEAGGEEETGDEEGGADTTIEPDEEAPAPELEPRKPDNASLDLVLTYADNTSETVHVRRVERSRDWWGESEWLSEERYLSLTMEAGGAETEVPWEDVVSLNITPGNVRSDTDCTYDSDYRPWMYTCELRCRSRARSRSGISYDVVDRHKWRFILDDDREIEFWVSKQPARLQDDGNVASGMDHGENYAIYGELQAELRNRVRTMIKSIGAQ
jgi:hypothetical protein